MSPRAIFDLDDPGVGIEAQLAREPLLDLRLGRWLVGEAAGEQAVGRAAVIEHALRRRAEELGGAVEPVELDEDRAGLLGAAVAHRRERPLDVATADIGRDPDRRLQAHWQHMPRSQARRKLALTRAGGRSWRSFPALRGRRPGR